MKKKRYILNYPAICSVIFMLASIHSAHAQTTIYQQTFNTDTAAEWSLNTADAGGDDTDYDNLWIINNIYAGGGSFGVVAASTPDEPAGITGYPESYYLHIYSYEMDQAYTIPNSCNYDGVGPHSYFAAQNIPVTTTGFADVNLSFWWLCKGVTGHVFGSVYYRTAPHGPWTLITVPVTDYCDSSSWSMQTIHLPEFDGQAFLEFGFQFKILSVSGGGGIGAPAFGIDDIKVTGISTTGVAKSPVADNIQVYPNPAGDELTVANADKATAYQLFNVTGIAVNAGIIGSDDEKINIENLPPGLYLLQLTDNSGNRIERKVVKK